MDLEDLRLAVYDAFRTTGRAPRVEELGPGADVGLRELAAQRHVVLDAEGEIVMAHPFAAVPLGFSVMGAETLWWGGCCWDSFALGHLLPEEPDGVLVATRCPGCDRPGAWVVRGDGPPEGDWLAHFLVPVARMWEDVVHTCSNQRLFCSRSCIDAWCASTGHEPGYVMDLATLWRLARGWYSGRLERGYVRREPAEAADHLRGVGLVDPFWGTA